MEMTTSTTGQELILDRVMPAADVTLAEHLVVDADPAATWSAARALDLLDVRSPLIAASFWVRDLPARLGGRTAPGRPERIALDGMPGWVMLGEDAGREVTFGAVGRFWTPKIVWEDVPAEAFAAFAEPGFGKIAAGFSVRPYGRDRTLLTYEVRTAITDPVSRARFARYWRLIRPFVGHIMRVTLRTIAAGAEHREADGGADGAG
jgi:hypothetical protein